MKKVQSSIFSLLMLSHLSSWRHLASQKRISITKPRPWKHWCLNTDNYHTKYQWFSHEWEKMKTKRVTIDKSLFIAGPRGGGEVDHMVFRGNGGRIILFISIHSSIYLFFRRLKMNKPWCQHIRLAARAWSDQVTRAHQEDGSPLSL